MEREENFSLQEFAIAVWRRKWTSLFVFLGLLVIGIAAITKIPVVYRSTGVILVEQQQIPTQWVNSTVASVADERIRSIGQRVLSATRIEQMIDKFNLFPDVRDKLKPDELVRLAQANFSIENVQAEIRDRFSGGRNSGTVAIQISYEYPSAKIARDVATELVSLYLEENLKARTDAASGTRLFLKAEGDRLEKDLAEIEARISEFKENNIGTLPEHQDINIQTYERVEQQIGDVDRTLGSLDERIVILETSIDSAERLLQSRGTRSGSGESVVSAQQHLENLRSQYVNLQTRYSAYHPDLIRLRREIGLLESQMSPSRNAEASGQQLQLLTSRLQGLQDKYSDEHPEVIRLQREIEILEQAESENRKTTGMVDAGGSGLSQRVAVPQDTALIGLKTDLQSALSEQRSLRARKAELIGKLAALDVRINKTPEVEREYRSLIRNHENIQDKYNDIRAKQNTARVAESLETEQKAERFTLIEAPRIPDSPHSPDYNKVSLLAIGIAFLGGLGAVFGLELVDARVRNIRSLESLTGVPVLATIGVIENPKDIVRRRVRILTVIVLLGLIVGAGWYLAFVYRISPEELRPGNLWQASREWMTNTDFPNDLVDPIRNWIANLGL